MTKRKNKKKVINPVKKKPSTWAILVGVICIIISCTIGNSINNHRLVRINGISINAPITEISYGNKGGRSGSVCVNGKKLPIYALDNNFAIGDSIAVRYDDKKSLVVQDKYNNTNFIVFFLLDGILLICGLLMLYAGITGKEMN